MSMHKGATGCLFAILLATAGSVRAANISEDLCGWTSVNVKYQALERLSLHAREETWMRDCVSEVDQWYLRFWLMYKLTPWLSIGPGYDYMETHTSPDAALDYFKRKNNYFAQAVLTLKWEDFTLAIRERYVYGREYTTGHHYKGPKRAAPPEDVNSNLSRTRFMLRYRISPDCPVTPFLYEEIFCWEKLTQTRSAAGASFKVNDWFGFDLSYIRQSKYHDGDRNNNVLSLDLNFSF